MRPNPSKTLTRLGTGVALAGMALLLTGCIYLRLLALKNQLTDFDRHVRVTDENGLTFTFLKPVMYTKDIPNLLEAQPTARRRTPNGEIWQWTFEKVRAANDSSPYELTFLTTFANDRLVQFTLPPALLEIIPRHLILGFVRSLGKANVDVQRREVTAAWQDGKPAPAQRGLTRLDVLTMMGPPLKESHGGSIYRYAYRLKSPGPNPAPPRTIHATCYFSRENEKLARVEVLYLSHRLNLRFN